MKGLAGKTGWPVDNVKLGTPNHFIAFVCYLGRIEDPAVIPKVYIVPSLELKALLYNAPGGRKLVNLTKIRDVGRAYKDAWRQLVD